MREMFAAEETVAINIWRNGKTSTISVQAEVFPKELALGLAYNLLGVVVENLSVKNRYTYKTYAKEGILITDLQRQSYLARIGVRPGDVIRQMDEITIKNVEDFKKAIIKYRHKAALVFLLQRADQLYNITVKL